VGGKTVRRTNKTGNKEQKEKPPEASRNKNLIKAKAGRYYQLHVLKGKFQHGSHSNAYNYIMMRSGLEPLKTPLLKVEKKVCPVIMYNLIPYHLQNPA